jgi:hypothetical protein
MGRPKLESTLKHVAAKVDPKLKEMIEAEAVRLDLSKSKMIAKLLQIGWDAYQQRLSA